MDVDQEDIVFQDEESAEEDLEEEDLEDFDEEDDEEDSDEELEVVEEEEDLRVLGSDFRATGVRTIFENFDNSTDRRAAIIQYLLYPDLRQDIVQELRAWIRVSEQCMRQLEILFFMFEDINVTEQIEQQHAETFLEFVDVFAALILEARRQLEEESGCYYTPISWPLPSLIPLAPVVAAKLLQYAQSDESIDKLSLGCARQHRAFRPHEVQQLVTSVLNLKQLIELYFILDRYRVLFVALVARLKELENLSVLTINASSYEGARRRLPNERHVMRNILQISSLQSLTLSSVILRESTLIVFSSSEASYTKLKLEDCILSIGDDDEDRAPSESLLAVALASNTRLEELYLDSVQGSAAFCHGIELGLLRNRTLKRLLVSRFRIRSRPMMPVHAFFGWLPSIRLHRSLRRLSLDMDTWSDGEVEAVCSVVQDNTSLQSFELFRRDSVEERWIGEVLQALQANRSIVEVRIDADSDFGYQNWNQLAELLTVNNSIQKIYLDAGKDSIPERLIELLQRVKSNRTLQRLGVENATFRQDHMSALVDVLADNFVLESLDYSFHDDNEQEVLLRVSYSDKGSRLLAKGILALNRYGRKYMTTEPNSVSHGVALLSRVSSNLDAVYFHIRENPRLCDRREWK